MKKGHLGHLLCEACWGFVCCVLLTGNVVGCFMLLHCAGKMSFACYMVLVGARQKKCIS